ncbi:unnamed protein product, partial [Rotaria sp. Silwood1]
CIFVGNSYQCVCPSGFNGPFCETSSLCNSLTCSNGGTCVTVSGGTGWICICPSGFTGDRCQNMNSSKFALHSLQSIIK